MSLETYEPKKVATVNKMKACPVTSDLLMIDCAHRNGRGNVEADKIGYFHDDQFMYLYLPKFRKGFLSGYFRTSLRGLNKIAMDLGIGSVPTNKHFRAVYWKEEENKWIESTADIEFRIDSILYGDNLPAVAACEFVYLLPLGTSKDVVRNVYSFRIGLNALVGLRKAIIAAPEVLTQSPDQSTFDKVIDDAQKLAAEQIAKLVAEM